MTITLDQLYVPDDDAYLALQAAMRDPDGVTILVAKQLDGAVTETYEAIVTSLSEKDPDSAESVVSIALTVSDFPVEVGT